MNDQANFLDKRTLIAIVMVGVMWVLWQSYLDRKYPDANNPAPAVVDAPAAPATALENVEPAVLHEPAAGTVPEKLWAFEDNKWRFAISSLGMGVREIQLKTYTDREGKPFGVGVPNMANFQTAVKGTNAPLEFQVEKLSDYEFKGTAQYQGAQITKMIRIHSNHYSLETQVEVTKASAQFPGLTIRFSEQMQTPAAGSLFAPSTDRNEAYVAFGTSDERNMVKHDQSELKTFNDVAILGLGSHYFAMALLDQSTLIPSGSYASLPDKHTMTGTLNYTPIHGAHTMNLSYQAFAGPKSLNVLRDIDMRMSNMIDFGKFSFIARPLLELMRWIYHVVHNWGVAIILLTLLVRLVLLPINVFSFRSMKAMQVIQPQLKALREKYKEDPKKLNTETMLLMKEHKVNPLGGCLPMLLQIPVFFALYAVLGQSIELYKAPFMLWIQDLSLKDPYYVLPVLMGLAMFLQQKLTPTSMDPAQAKVMMFMPILFSVFMLSLPSGLTLYIFISTLFGIAQQFVFTRESSVPAVLSAKRG